MSVRRSTYVFQYRLTFLGAEKVGKSAIIHQFVNKNFIADYNPTSEDHLTHVVEHEGNMCVCLFVDTSGSNDFPAMRQLSMKKGNAFVVVYSIDDKSSFDRAKVFVEEIKTLKSSEDEIKIVIVGNKSDKEEERKVSFQEGHSYASSLHEGNVISSFVETSAHDYDSVTTAIEKLLTMFISTPATEVSVINDRKFDVRASFSKLKFRRRSSKGMIDRRKSSELVKMRKKESLSDSEVPTSLANSPLMPNMNEKGRFRQRAGSQPAIKTHMLFRQQSVDEREITPRFFRTGSLLDSSISETGAPSFPCRSVQVSRRSLRKPRSVSVTSNSSNDSGVSDTNSPEVSPCSSPNLVFMRNSPRRASMPVRLQSYKPNVRRPSFTEKVRGIFKRTKSVCGED